MALLEAVERSLCWYREFQGFWWGNRDGDSNDDVIAREVVVSENRNCTATCVVVGPGSASVVAGGTAMETKIDDHGV